MSYGVHFTDLIAFQFENNENEEFTGNELTILYSPERDIVLMLVAADPFRAVSFVKGAEAAFTIYNRQVYAELDFFRDLMKDDPESLERINTMEGMVREAMQS